MNEKRKNSQFSSGLLEFSYHFWLAAAYTLTAIPCLYMADHSIDNDLGAFIAGVALDCVLVWVCQLSQTAFSMWRGVNFSDLDSLGGDTDEI